MNYGGDRLQGGAGNDCLDGGIGNNDLLDGGAGADVMNGGDGDDVVIYRDRRKPVIADLFGAKRNDGEKGEKDTIGADVEGVVGGAGNDTLVGNDLDNYFDGGEGNDTIRGGKGEDYLLGLDGDDMLVGGEGDDILVGEQPDGFGASGNDTAKDVLNGGAHGTKGDTCLVLAAATPVDCELFKIEFDYGF